MSEGSHAWGILAAGLPDGGSVSDGQMSDFLGDDDSDGRQRSKMLLAGLADGVSDGVVAEYSDV